MALTINTNVASLNAQRNLTASQSSLTTSLQRLSSGLRVNSAKDDAAGLAIAEKMNAEVRGMNVAMRNANDAISLAQTTEGAMSTIGDALQRMRELAVQAANGTNDTDSLANLDTEYQALATEVGRQIDSAKFNGVQLLDGTGGTITFQVGAGTGASDTIDVDASDLSTLNGGFGDLTSVGGPTTEIGVLDGFIKDVTTARATWGAAQNRFESVISSLKVASENISASRGRIMDADFAAETANLTRAQILQQAGTAMLAQANALPQSVLSLLK
jgi:flagellin